VCIDILHLIHTYLHKHRIYLVYLIHMYLHKHIYIFVYIYRWLAGTVVSAVTSQQEDSLFSKSYNINIYTYIYICMYIYNICIYISIYIIYTYQRLAGRDGVSSNITARRLPLFHIRCAQIHLYICLYIFMCTFHAHTRIYVYTHIRNIYIFMYAYTSAACWQGWCQQ